jgi:hypothetical protein
MSGGELNEQVRCGLGVMCYSVQCKDGGLDCDTGFCPVDRDEGEEPGFIAHGSEVLRKRIFSNKDSFSLAKEAECKVVSNDHIKLDNAIHYPYDPNRYSNETIKSGTISHGNEIFFYGGYKLYPGTYVEFDCREKISSLTLNGDKTEFLGINWPRGTKITISDDKIKAYPNGPMVFKGFHLDSNSRVTVEKSDGRTFNLTEIQMSAAGSHNNLKSLDIEIGGIKFEGFFINVSFDTLGFVNRVWAGKITLPNNTVKIVNSATAVNFKGKTPVSIEINLSAYHPIPGGFGPLNIDFPPGSTLYLDRGSSVSSAVVGPEGLKIGDRYYKNFTQLWFDKDGLPNGHVRYPDEVHLYIHKGSGEK